MLGFDLQAGLPPREQFFQRIHPDDRARFRERLERAKREKASYDLDDRYILPSGEIRDIRTVGHPVLSPSGDLREFVGPVIDDTERKRAEESLRKTEADRSIHRHRSNAMKDVEAGKTASYAGRSLRNSYESVFSANAPLDRVTLLTLTHTSHKQKNGRTFLMETEISKETSMIHPISDFKSQAATAFRGAALLAPEETGKFREKRGEGRNRSNPPSITTILTLLLRVGNH